MVELVWFRVLQARRIAVVLRHRQQPGMQEFTMRDEAAHRHHATMATSQRYNEVHTVKKLSGMLALGLLAIFALWGTAAWAGEGAAVNYRTSFAWLAPGVPGVLFEPLKAGPKAGIAVFAMHPDGDYLRPGPTNVCMNLAERGYRALCANAATSKAGIMSDIS
jgi:hypothetical protein